MQKYFRCISNADNKFKICETSRCTKFWRFDDIGKSCLNLIIIQRSPALRSYTSIKFHPFFLVDRSKKINLHTKMNCLCQNVGKWHGSNRRCTYFRGFFFLYLNYINEKDTVYKKLSIQYFEMCNDEFIGI